jgi:hypothetical protein
MYEITGILSEKFAPNGSVLRLAKPIHMELKTVEGVLKFIDEQKPFRTLQILKDGKDVTKDFTIEG